MSLATSWSPAGAGVKVLTFSLGFGPELAGLQRPPRHPLEDLGDPARRLCQIFRRRERGLDAVVRNARRHDRGRARRQLPPQEGRTARRDRGGRSDCQFPARDRDLHLPVHVLRQAEHDGARRQGRGGQCRGQRRLSGRRRRDVDRWQGDRKFLRDAAHRRHARRRAADVHDQARRFQPAIAGHAAAAGSEGRVRKRSPAWRAGHHPRDQPRRSRDRAGRIPPPRSGSASRKPGSWSSARWPISAASSPGAKPPIRSAGRSGSRRFPVRSRPSASPP